MEQGSAKIGEIFNFGMLHLEWPTALFILIVFVLTMIVLNSLLFKPVLRTLEARETEIDRRNSAAEKNNRTAEKQELDYQEKLAAIRADIQEKRRKSLDEALDEAKLMTAKTQEEMAKKLEEAQVALDNERTGALSRAAGLTESLSLLIKKKVLA